MHGFLGCVKSERGATDAMFRWMAEWIGLEPAKRLIREDHPPFQYLASAEPGSEDKPTAAGEDGTVVLFAGFIARDQFAGVVRREPRNLAETARALLQLYQDGGAEALAALNGRYVACVWDPKTECLRLATDMLGMMPVFVWCRNGQFAFSSNVWPLASRPDFRKAIDPRGLVDLLLLSHQQANRTLFADVSVLPPGSVTTVKEGRVSSRVVRNLKFSDERWSWSLQRMAEEMYALLAQSCRRCIPDGAELRLPLSGGFDSRVLLGLLGERPVKIRAVTQYQHGLFGLDARYAKRLARAAGVEHQVVPLGDDVFSRYREKCVAINGGTYDIHTGRFLSLLDQSAGNGLMTVSAFLGGEFTSRFQIPDSAFSNPEEHYRLAFGEVNMYRFSPDRLGNLLSEAVPKELVDEALEENRQFFLSHPGPDFHRFFNWDLLVSRRRYIAYQLFYYEQFGRVRAPFYDRDFADFMCSLPFAAIEGQRAYLEMLRRHFPALARVPNTNTDLPVLISTREILRDFWKSQCKRFLQRPLKRIITPRSWIGHPMEQYGFALRGSSRGVLDHLLRNRESLGPYLDVRQVQEAASRLLAGDNSESMGLLALSTLATVLATAEAPGLALLPWRGHSA